MPGAVASPRHGQPLVSVVTPFHDRVALLPALVEMLKAQTLADFELVIVDDGSTDGLEEAVERVQAPFPIRFIRLAQNRGAATARNAGIDAAQGRYVALLDSDDGWAPDKLAAQVAQLAAAERPGLVSLTRQVVHGRLRYVAPARAMTEADRVGDYLFIKGGVIQSSMMMLERGLAARVRFEDGGRGHDDWSFALRLEADGARFAMLEAPLTLYDDDEGRVRRSPAYSARRLDWLAARRAQLGDKAYWAAVAAVASHLPGNSAARPVRLILAARRNGAIGTARAAYYLAAWALPPLRRLARHGRQRLAMRELPGEVR